MRSKPISSEITVLHIGDFSSTRNWKKFVWDKMEFILVSSLVFVLSYLVLNYQAIYQNIEFKFKKARNVEVSQLASVLSVDESVVTESFPKPIVAFESEAFIGTKAPPLPKLNMAVYPPDTRIVIPTIFKNIPVLGVGNTNLIARDWDALEKDIQQSLRNGVVHYPGTALPGESGNVVITGHSSFYAWDPGRFKDVFGLLHEIKPKDKIYLFHNQKKYTYEVFDIRIVKPTEIDVLGQTNDERLTLITCTPLGTNLKRLVLTAKRVS